MIHPNGKPLNALIRPSWAGQVRTTSRNRVAVPGQVGRSVEVSGLVLPRSVAGKSIKVSESTHTFGAGLGFPHLADHLPPMTPEMWKSWAKLEQILNEAAVRIMGWDGPMNDRQVARSGVPGKALQLQIHRRTVSSTRKQDAGRLLNPEFVSGEVRKVFAIRDVSGNRLRFEDAGAAASFTLTPSSAHWSRDPRQL